MMALNFREYESLTDQELIETMIGGDGTSVQFLFVIKCGVFLKNLCEQYPSTGMDLEDLALYHTMPT